MPRIALRNVPAIVKMIKDRETHLYGAGKTYGNNHNFTLTYLPATRNVPTENYLVFSYNACIGDIDLTNDELRIVKEYIGYSKSTTRHISTMRSIAHDLRLKEVFI